MPEKITIRKASEKDIETLLSFEQKIIDAERVYDNSLSPQKISYYDLRKMLEDDGCLIAVAQTDNKIIASGFGRIENSKNYLTHKQHVHLGFMFVDPNFRGRGINQKIIDYIKSWARTKKINELRLDVYAENVAAVKAYEKAGFTKNLVEMRLETK